MSKKTVRTLQKAAPANFSAAAFTSKCGSTSSAIRELTRLGYSRGDVAQLLNKRYQHVRNVLITPIKNEKKVEQAGRVGTMEDLGVQE